MGDNISIKDNQEEKRQGGFVNIVRKGINKVSKQGSGYELIHKLDDLSPIEKMQYYIDQGSCDFHIHTNASDGLDSPPEILEKVMQKKLKAFAITDHDTFWGVTDCQIIMEKLLQLGMNLPELIPGVELSLDFDEQEVHLLAYFPSGGEEVLVPFLSEAKKQRDERNKDLCKRLGDLGLDISFEELSMQGGQVVNRVHVSNLLLRKGYVTSKAEAFEKWLGERGAAYMPAKYAPIETALDLIKGAGGISVLAHPMVYNWEKRGMLRAKLLRLKELGLDGIEVIHGDTSLACSRIVADIATELGLFKCIGSDYHGVSRNGFDIYGPEYDFSAYLK